jgi:hypothetical protein
VLTADADTTLHSSTGRNYSPGMAVDRDSQGNPITDSAWNAAKSVAQPELTIWLPGTYTLSRIELIPGFAKSRSDAHGDRWPKNNRLKSLRLMFPDGSNQSAQFADSATWRYETIALSPEPSVDHFTIKVEDVYRPDPRYQRSYGDTCLSDVRVWGYPTSGAEE